MFGLTKLKQEIEPKEMKNFLLYSGNILKQAFRQGKKLQEEIVPLSNIFNNRLDDLIDSSNKKDIISYYQNRNATNSQLPATGKDRVTSYFELEERIEGVRGDMSDVSFFYQGIIKYN